MLRYFLSLKSSAVDQFSDGRLFDGRHAPQPGPLGLNAAPPAHCHCRNRDSGTSAADCPGTDQTDICRRSSKMRVHA